MSLRNPKSPSVQGFNLLFEDENTIPYRITRLVETEAEAIETARTAKAMEAVRTARSLPDFVPEEQDAKLELIDFAAGSLVFALDAEPGEQTDNAPGDGAVILRDRLIEAYDGGEAKRLSDLLTQAISRNDPAVMKQIERNIFAFWPQLVERLRTQLNADYIDYDALPATLKERYISTSVYGASIFCLRKMFATQKP